MSTTSRLLRLDSGSLLTLSKLREFTGGLPAGRIAAEAIARYALELTGTCPTCGGSRTDNTCPSIPPSPLEETLAAPAKFPKRPRKVESPEPEPAPGPAEPLARNSNFLFADKRLIPGALFRRPSFS